MRLDTAIAAALVAAAVSLVGLAVTVLTTRWQVQSKVDELTQDQFKDVLTKRMEIYPKLWNIAQTYVSNWEREGKPVDEAWARRLFRSLFEFHAEHGVFLSYGPYWCFEALRNEALTVVQRCEQGKEPTVDDLRKMNRIVCGDPSASRIDFRSVGLADLLRGDLGGFKREALAIPLVS